MQLAEAKVLAISKLRWPHSS